MPWYPHNHDDRYVKQSSQAWNRVLDDVDEIVPRDDLDALYAPKTSTAAGLAARPTLAEANALYPDKAATEAALGRVAPGTAGVEGQVPATGPSGPDWMDDAVSLDWYSDPNAAIAAAKSRGIRARGQGDYDITAVAPVIIDHDADLTLATFTVNDADATAVRVGALAATVTGIEVHLPRVIQAAKASPSGGWTGTSVGVELRNLASSRVFMNETKHFVTGIYATANGGRGNVDNEFYPGWSNNNKRHIVIVPEDGTSWVNESIWIGGRLTVSSLEPPATPGARKILIGSAAQQVNSHVFTKMNIGNGAADDVAEYLLECFGSDNLFLFDRWEAPAGFKKVWFNSDANGSAVRNRILGGLGADTIEYIESGNARYNRPDTSGRVVFDGTVGTAGVQFVSDWTDQTRPSVSMLHAANGVLTRDPAQYVWGVSRLKSYFKSFADTFGRIVLNHNTGVIELGPGNAAPDIEIRRYDADRWGTADYFKVGTVAALPTATASYRGYTIRVEGGAGVADQEYECVKTSADTYVWRKVVVPEPQAALTAPNVDAIDATYDATEQGVIENLRTRVNELESRLQLLGLISV